MPFSTSDETQITKTTAALRKKPRIAVSIKNGVLYEDWENAKKIKEKYQM